MELQEEMVALEHLHIHHGRQQHQLVEVDLMQAAVVVELHDFNIQQTVVLAEEDLVDGV
jgi:hypothetical protein